MIKTKHFWYIHSLVAKRILSDVNDHMHDSITKDPDSDASKWFADKVEKDAIRIYEDPASHHNAIERFSASTRLDKWAPYAVAKEA